MRVKFLFRTLLVALLLQTLSIPGQADERAGKVVVGQISLSFYAVTGAVVQQVLERRDHPREARSLVQDGDGLCLVSVALPIGCGRGDGLRSEPRAQEPHTSGA
jgi:hypothetical protein